MEPYLSGRKLSNVVSELALEVGGFILGDGILGSETVEHGAHGAELGLGFSFVGELAEVANGITGSFSVITVAQTAARGLADAFE